MQALVQLVKRHPLPSPDACMHAWALPLRSPLMRSWQPNARGALYACTMHDTDVTTTPPLLLPERTCYVTRLRLYSIPIFAHMAKMHEATTQHSTACCTPNHLPCGHKAPCVRTLLATKRCHGRGVGCGSTRLHCCCRVEPARKAGAAQWIRAAKVDQSMAYGRNPPC